jgi:hypothetical protein
MWLSIGIVAACLMLYSLNLCFRQFKRDSETRKQREARLIKKMCLWPGTWGERKH